MVDYLLDEISCRCPYCNAAISLLVDTSVEQQTYIEDCEVCCRPITVSISSSDDEQLNFQLFQENDVS